MHLRITASTILLLSLSGCMTTPAGITADQQAIGTNVGLGAVQMIAEGDSKASVLEKLGSPEIITSADSGGELWVYDKLSTTAEGQSGATGLFSSAAAVKTSKKTMMTTIYFDTAGKVTDIKYRTARY